MALWLKGCHKCGGSLANNRDGDGFECLSCGKTYPRCRRCKGVAVFTSDGISCKCGTSEPFPEPAKEPHLPGEQTAIPQATDHSPKRACARCNDRKPVHQFGTRFNGRRRYLSSYCRPCDAARKAEERSHVHHGS